MINNIENDVYKDIQVEIDGHWISEYNGLYSPHDYLWNGYVHFENP